MTNITGKSKKNPLIAAEYITGDFNYKNQPNLTCWTSFGFTNKDSMPKSGTRIYQHIKNMENWKIVYMIETTTDNCKSNNEYDFIVP